jgi:hypothetical protein
MREYVARTYRFLVGGESEGDTYNLTRLWIIRGLGFIYLVAYSIIFFQGRGLWSREGLLPINEFLADIRNRSGMGDWELFRRLPSLFYFSDPDTAIPVFGAVGIVGGLVLLAGYANFFILLVLWLLQMSFANSGQLFYSYGWETQLLEFTFLCFFLVPPLDPRLRRTAHRAPRVTIWAMRWMLFRLMFGAGMIKIRGDECWRDLTCLVYHYETQPNPHPLSFFIHLMPPVFHHAGVLFNHFVELVVPFAVFGPARWRRVAGALTVFFQLSLIFSGNLAWLNWLTLLMCVPCFDDRFLARLKRCGGVTVQAAAAPNMRRMAARLAVLVPFTLFILLLSWAPAVNLVSSHQAMNTSYDQWHLVNSYGAFGSIGKERYEVIIKGTLDDTVTERTEWKEYEFVCAPGDVSRWPCLITPYHYHLDWQIWFSGMRPELQEEWLFRLAVRLLENNRTIGAMFARKPFGERAPKYIKMDLYLYHFADLQDWPRVWWKRRWVKEYMPPVSLEVPLAKKYMLRN